MKANGLTPVLLLFYDHDSHGLKITAKFRKNLWDCERGTSWGPDKLIIERFGLNKDDISKYNLTWAKNIETPFRFIRLKRNNPKKGARLDISVFWRPSSWPSATLWLLCLEFDYITDMEGGKLFRRRK